MAGKIRRKGKPYNPANPVHDRRTTDLVRGAQVAPIEIDDPLEAGGKLYVMRSTRDDPLADHHARGHIDEAQYQAGRAFQKHFGVAERGPRAVQWSEAVDGDPPRENLTDGQLMAGKWLSKCYRELGGDGSAIIHDVLVHARTSKQMAAARGFSGKEWESYFSKRLYVCLNQIAAVFGFATEPTGKQRMQVKPNS